MACSCCTSKLSVRENLKVEIKILKTDVVFPWLLLRIHKDMHVICFFWKRTIIMANKNDHISCVLTQICTAYNLILTCIWCVKFYINVFSNIKTNVAILYYKTDIACTCCKQLVCAILSTYPSPF